MTMTEAAKEAEFLLSLFKSLNVLKRDKLITLKTNSESAFNYVNDNVNHSRRKHIQQRHHFIHKAYQNSKIDLE
jgi:hypothetical protein